jgi:hypothetical protein
LKKVEDHLQQLSKLLRSQPGVSHDAAHGECINRIVTRNYDNSDAVRHDDMFTLSLDLKSGTLESTHREQVRNARNLA